MGKEIERKFLINLSELGNLEDGIPIKQAYISTTDNTVVRIRLTGNSAFITLKGENRGATRSEYEYAIPADDAKEIISELCSGPLIEKTRYKVFHSGHTWEIDIFHGNNDGLIVAEVELEDENENIEIPNWVTAEVTDDAKYYNLNLLKNPYCKWAKLSNS